MALPMVQTMKNRRYHRGIKCSPYEAMFGREMMLGNEDGVMPIEAQSEPDLVCEEVNLYCKFS